MCLAGSQGPLRRMDWAYQGPSIRVSTTWPALLLDDHRPYIHRGQHKFWVEAPLFASPYLADDSGLQAAQRRIGERVSLLSSSPD
jgi:hypothetical protein